MTLFLPARIFSVFVLGYGCRAVHLGSRASPSGVQMDVPGVEEDRTGCEEVARDSKSHFGAWHHAARRVMMPRAFPFLCLFVFFLMIQDFDRQSVFAYASYR